MIKWLRQHKTAALLLGCYGTAVLVWLGVQLAGFFVNRTLYASGALLPLELSAEDFEYNEGVERDGKVLYTLTSDPQMLLRETERLVENVEITFTASRPPLSVTVFWTQPGTDYELRKMAYPADDADGSYRFFLPARGVQALRIDPGIVPGNTIEIERIAINQKRPFYAFFILSAGDAAKLAVLPGLAASLISIVGQTGLVGRAGAALRKKVTADG